MLVLLYSVNLVSQTTCPHTPQQSRVAERKYRILLEACRALLFQSKLPVTFWRDCLLTATYLLNKIPSRILRSKSPYEFLYGQPPSYSHLKTFGCLAYATISIPQRDKLHPRAIPCVFVGYPFAKRDTSYTT